MKKIFKILIIELIGLLFLCTPAFSASFDLGYSLMVDHPTVRDDGLIPLAFSGIGGKLGLVAEFLTSNWNAGLEADFGMSFLSDRFGNGATLEQVWARGFVRRDLIKSSRSGTVSAGIPINFRMNDCYFYSWDDSHLYWQTSHWTGIDVAYTLDLFPGWRLNSYLDLPIAALVARPPSYRSNKQDSTTYVGFYFSRPNHDLNAVSLRTFRGIDASIGIEHPLHRSDIGIEPNKEEL